MEEHQCFNYSLDEMRDKVFKFIPRRDEPKAWKIFLISKHTS